MKWTPFQRECDHKYAALLTTKLRGNEQEDKNGRFWNSYIVYLVLCEAKLPLCSFMDWLDTMCNDHIFKCWWNFFNAILVWMRWQACHTFKLRIVISLIPLKSHPKRFWKKENLVKVKRTIINDIVSKSYLWLKNDMPGR